MADTRYINLLRGGIDQFNRSRTALPQEVIDLTGANLEEINMQYAGVNFSNANMQSAILNNRVFQTADFSGADLANAQLKSANLSNANLQDADLSNADCTSCNLSGANLTGVKVTSKTNFSAANFGGAAINSDILRKAKITGASLNGIDLRDMDFTDSSCEFGRLNLQNSNLQRANFSGAKLVEWAFDNSQLQGANFRGADLSRAGLHAANLTNADLTGAVLRRTSLRNTILDRANIADADFFEATLTEASASDMKGAYSARNLLSTKVDSELLYFSDIERSWPERWLDWERIRIVGRLPVFGASYAALATIPFYIYALGIYNEKISAIRAWLEHASEDTNGISKSTAAAVLAHLHGEPIPDRFLVLFISTICLAIAATIYALACPSPVKEFTRDRWCDELGKPLIHYWPEAWKRRHLRLPCAALYAVGGIGVAYALIPKLWSVFVLLWTSTFSP
jgi:uncharacterized protein YjbI with pentapeptide repeats